MKIRRGRRRRILLREFEYYYRFQGREKTDVIMALDLAVVTLAPLQPPDRNFMVAAKQLSPEDQAQLAERIGLIRGFLAEHG